MQQPIPNPEDITDPTTAMNMALVLMAKAFKLNYSTPTNNNQRISSNPRNRQIAQPGMNMGQDRQMRMVGANVQNVGNQVVQDAVQNQGVQNIGNGNVVAARAEVRPGEGMMRIFRTLQQTLMKFEEVNAKLLLGWQNLQHRSFIRVLRLTTLPSMIQTDQLRNQEGGTVDQHPATVEETRAYFESLYNNLALEVEKVNSVNQKMKETNADLTTELCDIKLTKRLQCSSFKFRRGVGRQGGEERGIVPGAIGG
ncbi:hypothetical protein Tco_0766790 [Tanacetum coccineum]